MCAKSRDDTWMKTARQKNRKIVSSPGMAKLHATPSFSSAATCRSAPFVTLPKFRSRLIQLSPPGAAASSSAE